MSKRALDIVLSAIALLVFLPFGMVIAVVLLGTGQGEVFYRQERVGLGGKLFRILKYVTMVKGSPSIGTGLLTVKDDPRVLPVGRFLRKTKLNEMPQLWNVLVGDMSIIGPRPQAQPHFRLYAPEVQRALQTVRPGLSGLGSIVFRNEEDLLSAGGTQAAALYAAEITKYKGALEVWYVQHRSLPLDLLLMALTVWVVIFPGSQSHLRLLPDLPTPPDGFQDR